MTQIRPGLKPQILRRPRIPVEGVFCSYSHRACMQNRLDGYDFCLKHILEDKTAPFKQCTYTSNKNGKRCPNAAPNTEKRECYCAEHARRVMAIRQRRKCRPKETPETLLEELEHYMPRTGDSGPEGKRPRSAESLANKVLEYASSSDTDTEINLVEHAWRGDGDSDCESVDSEQEDPLKHSGVYAAEEVALVTRDKLIRLQSLYIDQFKRLQHTLKEKRRKYLHNVRLDRDSLGSIESAKTDPDQQKKYQELMAMKRYHRRHGKEALLHRQSKERRIAVSEGANYKPPSYPRCVCLKNGAKCGNRTVPLSKFCFNHVLQDSHQVLYQPCNYGNGACTAPVARVTDSPSCQLHVAMDDIEQRLPNKREPETKEESKEEHIDVVGGATPRLVTLLPGQQEAPLTMVTDQPIKDQPTSVPSSEIKKEEKMDIGERKVSIESDQAGTT